MNDPYSIYVAKSTETGLYLTRAQAFFNGNQDWIEAAKPTAAEIARQLISSGERHPMWTEDINDAEVWNAGTIAQFKEYLPPVEFVPVSLNTVSS